MAVTHTSKVAFSIGLDENKIPEKLNWTAQEEGITNKEAKALMISVWDSKSK